MSRKAACRVASGTPSRAAPSSAAQMRARAGSIWAWVKPSMPTWNSNWRGPLSWPFKREGRP